jgi:cell division protein FtsB
MFEGLGFILVAAGFLIQYLSVPHPKTIAEVRQELKRLKAKQKSHQKPPHP